jgi:lipopolysaccharide export system protein LptA
VFHSLKRVAVSFSAVLACYCVYALAAVPFIEPEIELPDVAITDSVAPNYVERQRQWLQTLFLTGDWELTSPKILETPSCILLVKSYKNLPDGKMELRPCTAIFLSEDPTLSVEEQRRQAIVMRASEGAILEFDAGSDLRQARIGKLIGGRLIGPVTIRSDYKEPGPHDDLLVHTSDVELNQQIVYTARPIDFQLGPNRGRGKRMQIDLASAGQSGFRGMKSLELLQEVEVRLEPGNADVFPGNRPEQETRTGSRKQAPVEVRCRGPFRFDFEAHVATFREQVDVTRMNAVGPSDQLTCELLSILFDEQSNASATPGESPTSSLQPKRIDATGNPVIVRAPSNEMQGRGQQLEYDIATGGATFRGTQDVLLRQGHREIRARQVYGRPDETGQLGEFRAQGAGQVRGTAPDGPNQAFDATWTRSLNFRRHEGQQVLSVEGTAVVNLTGQGALHADEIHVWFNDAPKGAGQGGTSLSPDRMLAMGHVKIDSPQMTGNVNQMQAWFEPAVAPPPPQAKLVSARIERQEPPPPRVVEELPAPVMPTPTPLPPTEQSQPAVARPQAGPQQPSAAPPAVIAPAAPPAATPLPPAQRFHIEGDRLRMRMRTYGQQTELSEAIVDDRVKLRELPSATAQQEGPLLVTGDQLHLVSARPGDEIVTVYGRPAYVEARKLTLSSAAIKLNRGTNHLKTDASGVMTLPPGQGVEGMANNSSEPTEVTWQGLMTFDGRVARFEKDVLVKRQWQQLRTAILDVLFSRQINFSETKESGPSPRRDPGQGGSSDIDRIICRNGVWLENRTVKDARLETMDRLEMSEMTIVEATGDMIGVGPGSVTSWRLGGGDVMPGQANAPVPPAQSAIPEGEKKDDAITYLNVLFQRQMKGNLRRHDMRFEGQVRSLYGPVPRWDATLDPDHPEGWGTRGMQLSCDRMTVTELPQVARDKANYELEADGNTLVEGTAFTARAARLTFAQSKDLLVLEGNGRTNARLYRQRQPGAPPSQAEARKIFYWPSTNRAKIDDATFIDLSEMPIGPATKATKPADRGAAAPAGMRNR